MALERDNYPTIQQFVLKIGSQWMTLRIVTYGRIIFSVWCNPSLIRDVFCSSGKASRENQRDES